MGPPPSWRPSLPTAAAGREAPSVPARRTPRSCGHSMRLQRRHEDLLEALLVTRASAVRVERENLTSAVDDRELVDQPFELGNQMRGDEYGPPAGVAILVGADNR